MVNRIETNITQSANYVEKAKENTEKAVTYQQKARKVNLYDTTEKSLVSTFLIKASICLSSISEKDLDSDLLCHPPPHPNHLIGQRLRHIRTKTKSPFCVDNLSPEDVRVNFVSSHIIPLLFFFSSHFIFIFL